MTRAEITSQQVKPSTNVEGDARRRMIFMKAANDNRAPLSFYYKKLTFAPMALVIAATALSYWWFS